MPAKENDDIRLGIAPINWTNDDLPELGGEYPLERCLMEMREARFRATELGNKFPTDPKGLKYILEKFDLSLASCWHSTNMSQDQNITKEEEQRLRTTLSLLQSQSAKCINICETHGSIQGDLQTPLSQKSVLEPKEWENLTENLNRAGLICQEYDIKLCYHQHMGTVVQTSEEIQKLLTNTDDKLVHLCYDTGHLLYAGMDPHRFLEKHLHRIAHVHLKDIRQSIFQTYRHDVPFLEAVKLGIFTVPGDGMIPFRGIIRTLLRHGYDGWYIVEAEQDPNKANAFSYAKKASSNLFDIFRQIANESH